MEFKFGTEESQMSHWQVNFQLQRHGDTFFQTTRAAPYEDYNDLRAFMEVSSSQWKNFEVVQRALAKRSNIVSFMEVLLVFGVNDGEWRSKLKELIDRYANFLRSGECLP